MTISAARPRRHGFLLILALLFLPLPAHGYVLMGEHVLDRMVAALGSAERIAATQTVTLHAADPALATPTTLTETARLRQSGDYRSDASGALHERRILLAAGAALMVMDGMLQNEGPPRYTRYHDILIIRPRQALTEVLRRQGIDVAVSSLGRWEDDYCYVVGARFPDEAAPQLWVSKDTFLPVRLLLGPSSLQPGRGPVEIRYRNWTFVDGTAYPLHVTAFENHQIVQEIRVDRVEVNPVWPEALFDVGAFRREHARPRPEADSGPRTLSLPETRPLPARE